MSYDDLLEVDVWSPEFSKNEARIWPATAAPTPIKGALVASPKEHIKHRTPTTPLPLRAATPDDPYDTTTAVGIAASQPPDTPPLASANRLSAAQTTRLVPCCRRFGAAATADDPPAPLPPFTPPPHQLPSPSAHQIEATEPADRWSAAGVPSLDMDDHFMAPVVANRNASLIFEAASGQLLLPPPRNTAELPAASEEAGWALGSSASLEAFLRNLKQQEPPSSPGLPLSRCFSVLVRTGSDADWDGGSSSEQASRRTACAFPLPAAPHRSRIVQWHKPSEQKALLPPPGEDADGNQKTDAARPSTDDGDLLMVDEEERPPRAPATIGVATGGLHQTEGGQSLVSGSHPKITPPRHPPSGVPPSSAQGTFLDECLLRLRGHPPTRPPPTRDPISGAWCDPLVWSPAVTVTRIAHQTSPWTRQGTAAASPRPHLSSSSPAATTPLVIGNVSASISPRALCHVLRSLVHRCEQLLFPEKSRYDGLAATTPVEICELRQRFAAVRSMEADFDGIAAAAVGPPSPGLPPNTGNTVAVWFGLPTVRRRSHSRIGPDSASVSQGGLSYSVPLFGEEDESEADEEEEELSEAHQQLTTTTINDQVAAFRSALLEALLIRPGRLWIGPTFTLAAAPAAAAGGPVDVVRAFAAELSWLHPVRGAPAKPVDSVLRSRPIAPHELAPLRTFTVFAYPTPLAARFPSPLQPLRSLVDAHIVLRIPTHVPPRLFARAVEGIGGVAFMAATVLLEGGGGLPPAEGLEAIATAQRRLLLHARLVPSNCLSIADRTAAFVARWHRRVWFGPQNVLVVGPSDGDRAYAESYVDALRRAPATPFPEADLKWLEVVRTTNRLERYM